MNLDEPRKVEFFFEFTDPASWLAAAQIEEICARRSAILKWRAILPAQREASGPAQAAYRSLDLRRYSDHLGIPLTTHESVPIDARAACLVFLHAAETGREDLWCRRVLESLWAEGRPLQDEKALVELAAGLGFERTRLRAVLADPAASEVLRNHREELRETGLFTMPAFVAAGQIYMGHDRVFLLDEALEPSSQTTPFNRWFGARALKRSGGTAEYELVVTSRLANRRGVAHGGAVTSLLDSALGAAVVSGIGPQEWCATLQLNVQFREPVRLGRVVGKGRMVKRGRHAAFAEGEVEDAEGRVLAVATGTWYVWSRRPNS